ncbi:MAG: hypothetical protein EXS03_08045 [Phycisphaerales bacterium]|nr:hypothetical protein [Phycisphaerales bacterium]
MPGKPATFEAVPMKPGARIRVTQQVPTPEGAWTTSVEGTVQRWRQTMTGAWFAHSKDDHFWLDRVELKLDDGELTVLNLDQYSRVEEL